MWVYMVSVMCTVIPCAHVLESASSMSVEQGDTPAFTLINENTSSLEQIKSGRSYFSNSRSKNHISPLQTPVHDDPSVPKGYGIDHVSDSYPIVTTKYGQLRGFSMKTISNRPFAAFQSVPFAKAPTGNRRFREPERNLPWIGIRDAIEPSPVCIQADYMKQYQVHGQEDCLFLNVYTPRLPSNRRNKKLPVMVFIHGGGFFFGSSSIYGPAYMLDFDVILVTINYRLGSFGFLSLNEADVSGNNGFKDQVLALRWVQENIEFFNGDPSSVTIFGESAGASSVHFHMLSPLSRGLFHRGISQSGCATCFWSIDENPAATAHKFGSLLGCNGTSHEMIECLRSQDASQLAAMHPYFLQWLMYPVVVFGPVIESKAPGAFLSEHPDDIYKQKKMAKVPWISGYNSDEGAINIAVLTLSNSTLSEINTEWDQYGPVFLDLKDSGDSQVSVARKVRNFYLGDKNISFENRQQAIDMFGDRYSVSCGLKGIRYHSIHAEQPVYAYHLSYSGKYSIVQMIGQKSEDWGVSHLNDLVYQFNNSAYYPELDITDEEYKMSQLMNSLWTNFATFGKPLLTVDGKLKEIWEPVDRSKSLASPLKFLDLNLSPKMISDPFVQRDKFWRDLKLKD